MSFTELTFDSNTTGSSDLLDGDHNDYNGTFELISVEKGLAPVSLADTTLDVMYGTLGQIHSYEFFENGSVLNSISMPGYDYEKSQYRYLRTGRIEVL